MLPFRLQPGTGRGTVLGLKLDRMADSVSGQTVVDPKGYLTDLKSIKISTGGCGVTAERLSNRNGNEWACGELGKRCVWGGRAGGGARVRTRDTGLGMVVRSWGVNAFLWHAGGAWVHAFAAGTCY